MPRQKLTDAAIKKLKAPDPKGKQVIHWDDDLKGFGVLCSGVTTTKTFIVQRTLPDGRNRRLTVGAIAELSLEAARAKAADLIHQMRNGEDPKATRRAARVWTLRTALDQYVSKKTLRPKTIKDYKTAIERYLPEWLDLPLRSITSDMVEDRHQEIQADIERRKAPHAEHWQSAPGAHMANSVMVSFRAVWNFVEARDPDLPKNPVRILRQQWFEGPRRDRVVKADQLPEFYGAVEALENDSARDYIKLLLFTGLRRSEAAALRWDEIDFATQVIRLPAKRLKSGRKLDLPMTTFIRDLLIARRADGNDHGWVFGADSKSKHLEEPGSAFETIAQQTGIRISSHDLRRTFVTVAESTDISPLTLKALVNHALGGDVTEGYVQMTAERLRAPAQRVCNRLMELCGIALPQAANVTKLMA